MPPLYNLFENKSDTILLVNKHFVELHTNFDNIELQKRF